MVIAAVREDPVDQFSRRQAVRGIYRAADGMGAGNFSMIIPMASNMAFADCGLVEKDRPADRDK
jgi:hypothetical protein